MLKTVLAAGAITLALTGASFAEAPKDAAQCQTLLKDTFAMFQDKDDATKDKVTEDLNTLAEQCDGEKFAEAEKTAEKLKAMAK